MLTSSLRDSANSSSCITISGLGGHAYGSFKEKKGDHMWLRDSLPHHIPGLHVFINGYCGGVEARSKCGRRHAVAETEMTGETEGDP